MKYFPKLRYFYRSDFPTYLVVLFLLSVLVIILMLPSKVQAVGLG